MASTSEPSLAKGKIPSLVEQTQKEIFKVLSNQIQSENKHSVFFVGGSIPITSLPGHLICDTDETDSEDGEKTNETAAIPGPQKLSHSTRCDPITIRWDSIDNASSSRKVVFPYSDEQKPSIEQLLKDCQPATFGRGRQDILDETYRNAGKLDESSFSTNFNPYALGIIDTAAQALAPNNCRQTNETHGIRAELYKLNASVHEIQSFPHPLTFDQVYAAPSGKFKAHVDTPRSKHQVASLVVCLPSVHEGGQLVLRHQGRETIFDWSGDRSQGLIQWAAFYSDCEHEVLEVTAGQRVTLTYNLYTTCSANTARIDPEQMDLYQTLKTVLAQPAFCKNGITLGYHCAHAYASTSEDTIAALPATLKGIDKVVHSCFTATDLPVRLRHILDMDAEQKNACLSSYLECDRENRGWRGTTNIAPDTPVMDVLKKRYKKVESEDSTYYEQIDFNDDNDDIALLADSLVPVTTSHWGLYDGDTVDFLDEWGENSALYEVLWLNKQHDSHVNQAMALVHGAYGNEPSIETKYAHMVITLEIPPFGKR